MPNTKVTRSITPSQLQDPPTLDSLQHQWMTMKLKRETLLHLQHIADLHGPQVASIATDTLLIQTARSTFVASGMEWVVEEIRESFLEEIRAPFLEAVRVCGEGVMAWHIANAHVGDVLPARMAEVGVVGIFLAFLGVVARHVIAIAEKRRRS